MMVNCLENPMKHPCKTKSNHDLYLTKARDAAKKDFESGKGYVPCLNDTMMLIVSDNPEPGASAPYLHAYRRAYTLELLKNG